MSSSSNQENPKLPDSTPADKDDHDSGTNWANFYLRHNLDKPPVREKHDETVEIRNKAILKLFKLQCHTRNAEFRTWVQTVHVPSTVEKLAVKCDHLDRKDIKDIVDFYDDKSSPDLYSISNGDEDGVA
jgi:hypothetical protein